MHGPQVQPGRSQGRGACLTPWASGVGWGAGRELWVLQGRQGFPLNLCMLSVQLAPTPQASG